MKYNMVALIRLILIVQIQLLSSQSHELIQIDPLFDGAEARLIDINLDGKLDIIAANTNNNEVVWYENSNEYSFVKHIIRYRSNSIPQSVIAIDFDNDLDVDIFSTGYDDKIYYFENDGLQNFTESIFAGEHSFGSDDVLNDPNKIEAADFNNDGIYDLIVSTKENSINEGEAKIYMSNEGTYDIVNINQNLISEFNFLGDVKDLDADGDVDFLLNIGQENIIFYENDGFGNFTTLFNVDPFYFVYDSIYTDINNDNLNDIISVTAQFGINIYINNGNNTFNLNQTLPVPNFDAPFAFTRSVKAIDYNNDSFKDLILSIGDYGANRNEGILIFTNIGDSNFELYDTVFFDDLIEVTFFDIGDIDGDQDIDIIAPARTYSEGGILPEASKGLYLIKNQLTLSINSLKFNPTYKVFPNPTSNNIKIVNINCKVNSSIVNIYNELGQLIEEKKAKIINPETFELDFENYSSGIYFLKVNGETLKFIIKK